MKTKEEKLAYYRELLHAVQTGIGWTIALEPDNNGVDVNSDPNLRAHKHLRTGIDGSKADMGALARLLIAKGIITEDEYIDAIVDGMEREKLSHEIALSERLGTKITLA